MRNRQELNGAPHGEPGGNSQISTHTEGTDSRIRRVTLKRISNSQTICRGTLDINPTYDLVSCAA
jgi:hypothetical protein